MTIQSDILFIPEDFSTSQLNKRTEYLVRVSERVFADCPGTQYRIRPGISGCADLPQAIRPSAAVAVAGRFAAVL